MSGSQPRPVAPPGARRTGQDDSSSARASVVVATVGRASRLEPLVDAVLRDPAAQELVVVVDGPDPESRAVLADLAATRPRLRPLAVPAVGQLAALDAGVWAATCEVVVLLDDDVLPAPSTVAGHAAHHLAGHLKLVAGPMPVETARARQSVGTRLYRDEYLSHAAALERGDVDVLDVLWTGNLSIRRQDCLRIGLFNPSFGAHYHADRDLGYRLRAAGFTGVFDPTLRASHLHRRTDEEFLRDARAQGVGRVAIHRAHADRLGPFELDQLVRGLPLIPGRFVVLAGQSSAAEKLARGLLGVGRVWGSIAPGLGDPVALARLARRVMQVHGAAGALRAAQAGRSPAPAPGRESRAPSSLRWSSHRASWSRRAAPVADARSSNRSRSSSRPAAMAAASFPTKSA